MLHSDENTPEARQPVTLIAGCGDVGCRLAVRLLQQGHRVYGLRRDISRLPEGVQGIAADLSSEGQLGDWPEHIDYVVFAAAAGGRGEENYRRIYLDGLGNVLSKLTQNPPKRFFFTSSTAVYHQNAGEWVDELSPTRPERFNGKIMLAAEAELMQAELSSTVVRFGGIYGPGRNYMLNRVKAGEVYAPEPVLYGNRVHAEDCAGMLAFLINEDQAGRGVSALYLGVDSDPAPLSEVTAWLAKACGIETVSHINVSERGSKRCRNKRITDAGYVFQYPGYQQGYSEIIAKLAK